MSWARIMAPLSGGTGDAAAVAAAVMLAEPFQAEMAGVYTPADVADVMPWMGEGFLGGVQTTALESLKEAAQAGEAHAQTKMAATNPATGKPNGSFIPSSGSRPPKWRKRWVSGLSGPISWTVSARSWRPSTQSMSA